MKQCCRFYGPLGRCNTLHWLQMYDNDNCTKKYQLLLRDASACVLYSIANTISLQAAIVQSTNTCFSQRTGSSLIWSRC